MRTGIFEYLRKCVREITGRDPEEEGSSHLYKFYSQSTRNQMGLPASGTTPFKHSVITPVQTPPGVYYDTSGKVTKPHIYDATMGDAMRVMPMVSTGISGTLGTLTYRIAYYDPELTIGSALASNVAGADPDEWKWGSTIGLAINTADNELIAAVASKKIQIVITKIVVRQTVANATQLQYTVTLQDSDNVDLSGTHHFTIPSQYTITATGGGPSYCRGELTFPWMGAVAYSATANRAIEADIGNVGAAGDVVDIYYAWREFS